MEFCLFRHHLVTPVFDVFSAIGNAEPPDVSAEPPEFSAEPPEISAEPPELFAESPENVSLREK